MKSTTVKEFDPGRVLPFPGQPRKRFAGIQELAKSIKAVGQIIPGKVTLVPADNQRYDARLIDGERRLRACQIAGIPFRAEVLDQAGTEDQQFETSLAANFGKQDHDCIEIAEALGRLQQAGRTLAQMSDICGGKSACWILQHLSLLKLHPDVQAMFLPSGKEEDLGPRLSLAIGMLLANHPHDFQLKLARKIAGKPAIEARRIILRMCNTAGVRAGKNTTSPADRFNSLTSCLHHMTHRLGVFADMPAPDLRGGIATSTAAQRRHMIDQVDDLVTNLTGISEELAQSQARPTSGPKPFVRDYAKP
jgi:ParB/RepB/Spo0J family partition protein